MRVFVAVAVLVVITTLLTPLVRVAHSWRGAAAHEDVALQLDCYVLRAETNGHGKVSGALACAELVDQINHDDGAAYLVVSDDVGAEAGWVEASAVWTATFTLLAALLGIAAGTIPSARPPLRRFSIQAAILGAAGGVVMLNAVQRLLRAVERPHDLNGATFGEVGVGVYVTVACPLVLLAHSMRLKTDG